jgi:hypothetical protein
MRPTATPLGSYTRLLPARSTPTHSDPARLLHTATHGDCYTRRRLHTETATHRDCYTRLRPRDTTSQICQKTCRPDVSVIYKHFFGRNIVRPNNLSAEHSFGRKIVRPKHYCRKKNIRPTKFVHANRGGCYCTVRFDVYCFGRKIVRPKIISFGRKIL